MSTDQRIAELLHERGFTLHGLVGEGVAGRIYLIEKDSNKYALKLQKSVNDNASQAAQERFHREALNLARLSHHGLPKIFEIGTLDGCGFIIMEFIEAASLRNRLKGRPLGEREVRELAIQLSEVLLYVHRSGLVHRDLKPENILFSESGNVKLIDFSLAESDDELKDKREVAGSFNYCSPEQSGMLTLPVDGRADLYSLGVILFECLTGRLPFIASSVSEILRKHAAEKVPEILEFNPSVSAPVVQLINRLLQKDPDDRPASAREVLAVLAPSKAADIKQPLVGRVREMETLRAKLELLAHGEGQVALITGASGSGKSRLFGEIGARAAEQEIIVLHGKALEGIVTPYQTLRSAIERWLLELARNEKMRTKVSGALRGFFADWAAQLRQLSVHFTRLFPEDVGHESASASDIRFDQVIYEFFSQLNRRLGPVLFIVDDVQWLDSESRSLLSKLASSRKTRSIFIALTARSCAEYAESIDDTCRLLDISVSDKIELDNSPFGLDETEAFVQMIFGVPTSTDMTRVVASKIHAVAKGNAFFTGQYLKAIIDKTIVRPHWGRWLVKDADLDLLLSTDNVHELLARRISQLSEGAVTFLAVAALVGQRFEADLIARVAQCEQAAPVIEELVKSGLIERNESDAGYSFVHDRAREAALALSDENKKRSFHKRVADVLRESEGDAVDVARHSQMGLSHDNQNVVFSDCEKAGIVSLQRNANAAAYQFFQSALKISPSITPNYEFFQNLGDACARIGLFEESKVHLERALSQCSTPSVRAHIRTLIAFSNFHLNDAAEAYREICRGFDELNCNVTRSTPLALFYSFLQLIGALLILVFRIPPTRNVKARERFEALCMMYINLGMFAFTDLKMLPIVQATQRGSYLRLRLGGDRNLAVAASTLAPALALQQWHKLSKKLEQKAEALSHAIGDPFLNSDIVAWKGIAMSFRGDETEAEIVHREIHRSHRRTVKADDYYHSQILLVYGLFARGFAREAVEIAEEALHVLRDAEHSGGTSREYAIHMLEYMCIPAFAQIGQHSQAHAFLKRCGEQIEKHNKNALANCVFALASLLYDNQQESPDEVLENHIAAFKREAIVLIMVPFHAKLFYVAQVQARLLQWRRGAPEKKRHFEKLLRKALFELKIVSDRPLLKSYYHLYCGLLSIDKGRVESGLRELARADELATIADNRMVIFEVARARGIQLSKSGDSIRAAMQYDVARMLAGKYGWNPLLAALDNEFSHATVTLANVSTSHISKHSALSSLGNSTTVENVHLVRYLDAFLKVGLASSEILDFKKHSQNVLDSLVEILNAERALLFLWDGKKNTFEVGRTNEKHSLDVAEHYSQSLVEAARIQGRPILLATDGQGNVSQTESVIANELRSVLAAPLLVAGKFVGVIYLDSRVAKGIFQMADAQILQAVGQHFAISIQMARNAKLELEKKLLEKDLEATEVVQSLFVPKVQKISNQSIELTGFSKSASKSGGDWWFYETLENGVTRVILADVSGHGVGSAMVTGVLAGLFQALRHLESSQYVEALNRHFLALCREKYLATLLVCEIGNGEVKWWNAGAPLFLVIRGNMPISCTGPGSSPLGLDETLSIPHKSMSLEDGDRIVLFTDGCFDAALPNHGRLGLRKLRKMVTSIDAKPSSEFMDKVVGDLLGQKGSAELEDDLTLIVVDYKEARELKRVS